MNRIKVLAGYAAHSRYLAENETIYGADDAKPVGYIVTPKDIPSPFYFAATRTVWPDKNGRNVVIVETRQRRYEVFEVTDETIYATEDEAFAARKK